MQTACVSKKKELASAKKISVKELITLGYTLTEKQIPLGKKPYNYGVLELKNELGRAHNKEVPFCLLYSTSDKLGIILPNSFNYYLSRPSVCLELLR